MLVQPYDVLKESSEWHIGENRPVESGSQARKESRMKGILIV